MFSKLINYKKQHPRSAARLSAGLDPKKVTLVRQSRVVVIAELTVIFSMLVSVEKEGGKFQNFPPSIKYYIFFTGIISRHPVAADEIGRAHV